MFSLNAEMACKIQHYLIHCRNVRILFESNQTFIKEFKNIFVLTKPKPQHMIKITDSSSPETKGGSVIAPTHDKDCFITIRKTRCQDSGGEKKQTVNCI